MGRSSNRFPSAGRHLFLPIAVSLLFATCLPRSVPGADLEDLFIGGFVSQGYIDTSENSYLVPQAREGSGEFNEVGVALSIQPQDRTRIGIQFLARDLGDQGNNQVLVDWAYGDYRWRDDLGFRAGKIKLPYGLYSVVRDIDVARTFVLLPQGVYDERLRDFFSAYEGAGLYGNKRFTRLGEFDYEVYVGALNVPEPSQGFWNQLFQSIGQQSSADPEFLDEISTYFGVEADSVVFGGVIEPQASLPWLVGAALVWNAPLDGLRLGGSWLRSRYEATARILFNVWATDKVTGARELFRFDIGPNANDDIDFITSLSAEYSKDAYTVAAEYTQQNTGGGLPGERTPVTEGYYVSGSYRVLSAVTLGSYYSRYYTNRYDRKGRINPHDYPNFSAWQYDLCIGTRIDMSSNWLLKFEQHWVDGVGQLSPSENPARDDIERFWSYFTAKATFHF